MIFKDGIFHWFPKFPNEKIEVETEYVWAIPDMPAARDY